MDEKKKNSRKLEEEFAEYEKLVESTQSKLKEKGRELKKLMEENLRLERMLMTMRIKESRLRQSKTQAVMK